MLLRRIDNSGYPADYLVARLGVRSGALIADWRPFLALEDPLSAIPAGSFLTGSAERTKEGIWKCLLREYSWVYSQMDNAGRENFSPYFAWFELRTLMMCLRNRVAKNTGIIKEMLEFSLFSGVVKHILTDEEDPSSALAALEVEFVPLSTVFCGLGRTFREQGLRGLEEWLNDAWLEFAIGTVRHPVLRDFFSCMIDFRNLMQLYKRIRWEMSGDSSFLGGGNISRVLLAAVLAGRDPAAIASLLRRFPGTGGAVDPSVSPEHYLLHGITRRLRRLGREPSVYGLIMEYLWRLYIETVNMGILCNSGALYRENVMAELVQ